MLCEAKQGSKAYEYIKSILDAEFEEHQARGKLPPFCQRRRVLAEDAKTSAVWVGED